MLRNPPGTNSATGGTSGSAFWIGYAVCAGAIALGNLVHTLSAWRDMPHLAWWKPLTWETSSAVVSIALLPVVAWTVRRWPYARGRSAAFLAFHMAGSVAFAMVHVTGFNLLRKAVHHAMGETYRYGSLADYLYEWRKDLLGYAAVVAVFSLAGPLLALRRPTPSGPPALFDIRDGSRTWRTPVGEIIAAASAGNYVEFVLADGRRPLMRATLAAVEAELSAHGFVRTHRSWLVNPARVRSLEPEGSGDYRLGLEGGGHAPLSRRFPRGLEAVRRPV